MQGGEFENEADQALGRELVALIPQLRAFARSLTYNDAEAEDLAQEAFLRAWQSRANFTVGTNLKSWAFVILRNHFLTERRRSWRSHPLDPKVAETALVAHDNPLASLELAELRQAMERLPVLQREAVALVGAGGVPYDDAAEICGCAVGTVKSRVNRGRQALLEMMERGSFRRP